MTFGETLVFYRNENDLTRKGLSVVLGVTSESIRLWETDSVLPTLDTLVKLSKVFDCKVTDLVAPLDDSENHVSNDNKDAAVLVDLLNNMMKSCQELLVETHREALRCEGDYSLPTYEFDTYIASMMLQIRDLIKTSVSYYTCVSETDRTITSNILPYDLNADTYDLNHGYADVILDVARVSLQSDIKSMEDAQASYDAFLSKMGITPTDNKYPALELYTTCALMSDDALIKVREFMHSYLFDDNYDIDEGDAVQVHFTDIFSRCKDAGYTFEPISVS